jgi:hypothetical protein
MLAVLEAERQALAAMNIDALSVAGDTKLQLVGALDDYCAADVDAECRGLLEAARHQNEVNRKVRNLLAANVAARLDALTRSPGLYTGPRARRA